MADNAARWSKHLGQSGKPAYLAIADAIAAHMQAGGLAANENLPPMRALALQLGLNYSTVARAYAEAQRRGLVGARSGRGTFVKPAGNAAGAPARSLGFIGLVEMTMNLPPSRRTRRSCCACARASPSCSGRWTCTICFATRNSAARSRTARPASVSSSRTSLDSRPTACSSAPACSARSSR
jgi:hypothetical protein